VVKDDLSPKQIDRYLVKVENFDAIRQLDENGRKFTIDPQRLLCALRWKRKRHTARCRAGAGARAQSAGLVSLRGKPVAPCVAPRRSTFI
jgi:hypothetical protein